MSEAAEFTPPAESAGGPAAPARAGSGDAPSSAEAAPPGSPASARLGPRPDDPDRWERLQPPRGRGATGRGVIALVLIATVIGGLIDMANTGSRGHLFGIFFAIASAVGALVVRRRDLSTAMVGPPLVYCVSIVVMSFIDRGDLSGGFVTREVFYVGNAFVTGAPAIWIGTALAIIIGLLRKRTTRPPRARR